MPLGPPTTFTFAWSLPCSVPVEERSERDGVSAHLRFSLGLRALADGRIEVRWDDMDFVEFMGEPLTPERRKEMAPVLAVMTFVPNMFVTKHGAFVGIGEIDKMLERLDALGVVKPEGIKTLRTPEARAALSTSVGNYWQTWVGAWAGLQLARGEVREGEGFLAFGNHKLPAHTRIGYVGDDPGGLARLSSTTTMEGSEALAALKGAIGAVSGSPLPADGSVTGMRYMSRMDVQTDPATLRPRRTHYEIRAEITDNGESKPQKESRDDEFSWERAKGCL